MGGSEIRHCLGRDPLSEYGIVLYCMMVSCGPKEPVCAILALALLDASYPWSGVCAKEVAVVQGSRRATNKHCKAFQCMEMQ